MEPAQKKKTRPRFQVRPFELSLIAVSLGCNIAALILPFLTLRKGVFTEAYSLPNSVTLLWDKGLYVLALLVALFSILFPFAKLCILAWVATSRNIRDTQRSCLHFVERFGKWSMLDVFLVSIILSLASKQFLVGAKPQLGLSLFIISILLSMTCGELLVRNLPSKQQVNRIAPTSTGTSTTLTILYSACLIASLFLPFLRIEDWLLANREYSILTLVPALWRQGAWLAAVLTMVFLIATPLFALSTSLLAWFRNQNPNSSPISEYWVSLAHRWSMLDVFGLSLVIFALESDHLMSAEIRWGALSLAAALLLQFLLSQSIGQKQSKETS